MRNTVRFAMGLTLIGVIVLGGRPARADDDGRASSCKDVPSHAALRSALELARAQANGGLGFNMWGTVVNRDGIVCAVAFTGNTRGDQWPGSRVISAQKANTANAFSLPHFALSTANLYTAVQPGGSLFGLQESNPVDTDVAYSGNPANYGQRNDPMVGGKIGGVNVFGGGLALYNAGGRLVGALGVSGDTSCADHNIAYRTRDHLNLDYVPAGVGDAAHKDNAIYDVLPQGGGDAAPGPGQMPGVSRSGFGHASCHGYNATGNAIDTALALSLPHTK